MICSERDWELKGRKLRFRCPHVRHSVQCRGRKLDVGGVQDTASLR